MAAVVACLAIAQLAGCGAEAPTQDTVEPLTDVAPRPEIYAGFALTADLGIYTDGQREMIALLIEASEIIDDLFWQQTWGPNPSQWLASIDTTMRACLRHRIMGHGTGWTGKDRSSRVLVPSRSAQTCTRPT